MEQNNLNKTNLEEEELQKKQIQKIQETYDQNAHKYYKMQHNSKFINLILWPFIIKTLNCVRSKFSSISEFKKPDRILDAGCGGGYYCFKLAEDGFENIYGCDISQEQINIATTLKQQEVQSCEKYSKIEFQQLDILNEENLLKNYEENSFDAIMSVFVLDHMENNKQIVQYLKNLYKLLKTKNSQVFIVNCDTNKVLEHEVNTKSVANYEIQFKNQQKKILEDGDQFQVKMQGFVVSEADTYWETQTIEKYMKEVGFKNVETRFFETEQNLVKDAFSSDKIQIFENSKSFRLFVGYT